MKREDHAGDGPAYESFREKSNLGDGGGRQRAVVCTLELSQGNFLPLVDIITTGL